MLSSNTCFRIFYSVDCCLLVFSASWLVLLGEFLSHIPFIIFCLYLTGALYGNRLILFNPFHKQSFYFKSTFFVSLMKLLLLMYIFNVGDDSGRK